MNHARLLVLSLLLINMAQTQGQKPKDLAPSIRGEFRLPLPTGPKAFQDIFQGVFEADLYGQYPLQMGLAFGAGGKVSYFELNDRSLAPITAKGDELTWAVYGRLAYERRLGENTFFDLAVNVGWSSFNYSSNHCESTQNQTGMYLEPKGGVYIYATEKLAFGIVMGYQWHFQEFNEELICLENLPRHQPGDTEGNIGMFSIGVAFSTSLVESSSVFR